MAPEEAAPAPVAAPRIRSEWLERLGGQALALLGSLAIALAVGSILIVAYGETPMAVYGAILRFSVGQPRRLRVRAGDRDAADLLGPRGRGVLQGRHVQHRRRRPVLRRHGDRGVGGREPGLPSRSDPRRRHPDRRHARRAGLGGHPGHPQGEDGRARGRDDDHAERHRDQPARVGDQVAAAVHVGPHRSERRHPNRQLPAQRAGRGPGQGVRDHARARTCPGCSSWRSRPRSSSGSSCAGPAWATRLERSAPRRAPPGREASRSGRRSCACS